MAVIDGAKHQSTEGLLEFEGRGYYAVPDVDQMPPFLMSIVSDGDRWMFVSSNGALTAGRVDSSRALFPYETDDRLHQAAGITGPISSLRFRDGATWSPLRPMSVPQGHRCLYRSVVGDSIIFEEVHAERHLTFRYRWTSTDDLGFIRSATLINDGETPVDVDLIDGLLNILPHGLDPALTQTRSNLTNAYKRSEIVDERFRIGVYSLEAGVVDRPDPAEVLRASAVWSVGLDGASVTVSPDAVSDFESGETQRSVSLSTGRPGAYLLCGAVSLEPGEAITWHIVSDVARDQFDLAHLRRTLESSPDVPSVIEDSIEESSASLVRIMALADAQQRTGDRVATAHQFANVTYNVLRGGVPLSGYVIRRAEFTSFLLDRNRAVAEQLESWLKGLPAEIQRRDLLERIADTGNGQLMRIGMEYLPFGFSRRHGDPSRPWNRFSIRVRDESGEPIIYYEGNWRDIFQNWEALCMSFPQYLPGTISVFVNASTPDGFNPYRITSNGIDWEVPDPSDPWSHIGYWGDHQIVYLLRLLEATERYLPGELERMLFERLFSYANVPYRLVSYQDLVEDPKSTIVYDEVAAASSAERSNGFGSDGKLLLDEKDEPYLVTLLEKLLVAALSKLSNFVPGGGIWMNTQRPEWNDANNALVGHGLSMVTLYHLRRYLDQLRTLLTTARLTHVEMSTEVGDWLSLVAEALSGSEPAAARSTDQNRRKLLDQLGGAFSDYRSRVYASGFSGTGQVAIEEVVRLCDAAIQHLDDTIRHSRRDDGLYHSYNLISFTEDGTSASVEHLYEMLEGQVAVLSSGVLTFDERADVIDALFSSEMYRADQRSFTLYPSRRLPSFLEKNVVPHEAVEGNGLLEALVEAGDSSLLSVDVDGRYRFNPDFASRDDLEGSLDRLADEAAWTHLVDSHREATLDTYEQVFRHHSYTGRSGSMYGYEGIGSIYWHMVAKLLVAVQESAAEAVVAGAKEETVSRLTDAYWRVRSGLGFNKTAREFGAIPTEPYSHTPAHAGAQQPGMTGLVKEELLTRPLEVGVRVADGQIVFDPLLLRSSELLIDPEAWSILDLALQPELIGLEAGSLGTTICQVPVVVSAARAEAHIEIDYSDGRTERRPGLVLDRDTSALVFARSGDVKQIRAYIPAARLPD